MSGDTPPPLKPPHDGNGGNHPDAGCEIPLSPTGALGNHYRLAAHFSLAALQPCEPLTIFG